MAKQIVFTLMNEVGARDATTTTAIYTHPLRAVCVSGFGASVTSSNGERE
jgi:hypothetical protein